MFDLITGTMERPLRERAPGSKVTSIVVHVVVLTLVVVIPLLRATNTLPDMHTLMVFGAYLRGTDALTATAAATGALLHAIEPAYHTWFTQADYLIYPWLQATGRYETVTPADAAVQSIRIGTLNVSALVRANVKV